MHGSTSRLCRDSPDLLAQLLTHFSTTKSTASSNGVFHALTESLRESLSTTATASTTTSTSFQSNAIANHAPTSASVCMTPRTTVVRLFDNHHAPQQSNGGGVCDSPLPRGTQMFSRDRSSNGTQTLSSSPLRLTLSLLEVDVLSLLDEVPLAAPYVLFHHHNSSSHANHSHKQATWTSVVSTALRLLLQRNAVLYAVRRNRITLPVAAAMLSQLWFTDRPDPTIILSDDNQLSFAHSLCVFDMLLQALQDEQKTAREQYEQQHQYLHVPPWAPGGREEEGVNPLLVDPVRTVDTIAYRILDSIVEVVSPSTTPYSSSSLCSVAVVVHCEEVAPLWLPLSFRGVSFCRQDSAEAALPLEVLEGIVQQVPCDQFSDTLVEGHPRLKLPPMIEVASAMLEVAVLADCRNVPHGSSSTRHFLDRTATEDRSTIEFRLTTLGERVTLIGYWKRIPMIEALHVAPWSAVLAARKAVLSSSQQQQGTKATVRGGGAVRTGAAYPSQTTAPTNSLPSHRSAGALIPQRTMVSHPTSPPSDHIRIFHVLRLVPASSTALLRIPSLLATHGDERGDLVSRSLSTLLGTLQHPSSSSFFHTQSAVSLWKGLWQCGPTITGDGVGSPPELFTALLTMCMTAVSSVMLDGCLHTTILTPTQPSASSTHFQGPNAQDWVRTFLEQQTQRNDSNRLEHSKTSIFVPVGVTAQGSVLPSVCHSQQQQQQASYRGGLLTHASRRCLFLSQVGKLPTVIARTVSTHRRAVSSIQLGSMTNLGGKHLPPLPVHSRQAPGGASRLEQPTTLTLRFSSISLAVASRVCDSVVGNQQRRAPTTRDAVEEEFVRRSDLVVSLDSARNDSARRHDAFFLHENVLQTLQEQLEADSPDVLLAQRDGYAKMEQLKSLLSWETLEHVSMPNLTSDITALLDQYVVRCKGLLPQETESTGSLLKVLIRVTQAHAVLRILWFIDRVAVRTILFQMQETIEVHVTDAIVAISLVETSLLEKFPGCFAGVLQGTKFMDLLMEELRLGYHEEGQSSHQQQQQVDRVTVFLGEFADQLQQFLIPMN